MKKYNFALIWMGVLALIAAVLWFILVPGDQSAANNFSENSGSQLGAWNTWFITVWVLFSASLVLCVVLYLRKKTSANPEREFSLGFLVNMHLVLQVVLLFLVMSS